MSPGLSRSVDWLKKSILLWGLAIVAVASVDARARAAELIITVTNVRDSDGVVSVALCPEEQFLGDECPYYASAPAIEGDTYLFFPEVDPGTYGVQGFHDANANGEMDMNFVGWPLEGFAFANDPQVLMKAPSFEEASVTLGEDNLEITISMRYRTPGF